MDWDRTWSWASAVVLKADGMLEFRSGFYGLCTLREISPPRIECSTRFVSVYDYWGNTYR